MARRMSPISSRKSVPRFKNYELRIGIINPTGAIQQFLPTIRKSS